jgi:DNA polymerase III epsilon subunit family exonuclease
MRKVLNLHGRPPKRINEIARNVLSADSDFIEIKEGIWSYNFPVVFQKALESEHFVSLDIEATGGRPPVEKIVEIGAVKYRDSKEIDEYSFLVNPEKPIQPFVAHMTGINDDLLAKGHPIESVLKGLLTFIKDHVLILHDPFPDMAFIDEESLNCFGGVVYNPIIDTLVIAKTKLGLHAGLSLGQIADRLNIERMDTHRALEDARTTGKAYFILRELNDCVE